MRRSEERSESKQSKASVGAIPIRREKKEREKEEKGKEEKKVGEKVELVALWGRTALVLLPPCTTN